MAGGYRPWVQLYVCNCGYFLIGDCRIPNAWRKDL